MPNWPIRFVLVVATVLPAVAGLAAAGPVALPLNPVNLDEAGELAVNQVVSGTVLRAVGGSHSLTLKPKLHYNPDATLTLYNDPDNDGAGGPSSFSYLGAVVNPVTTPFVADPEVRDDAPGDPDAFDYTVSDGLLAWRATASADTEGPDPLAVQVSLDESGPFPGPLGDHRVEVCVSTLAPRLLGCLMDVDRDGYSNHQELLAGSDPTDPTLAPGQSLVLARAAAAQDLACARFARAVSSVPPPVPPVPCPLPEVP